MSIGSDWYVTPGADINIGYGEHMQYATAYLLGYPIGEALPMHKISPRLSPDIVYAAKKRKVSARNISLSQGDSRKAVSELFNWVRVARAKGGAFGFDVWEFDENTIDLIRNSQMLVAEKPNLSGDDVVWINELSTNDYFEVPLKRLLSRAAQPEALKRVAMGVGKFRNPPPNNPYIIR